MANHAADRLTKPLIRVGKRSADDAVEFGAEFREASWEEAMGVVRAPRGPRTSWAMPSCSTPRGASSTRRGDRRRG